jgi:hypothetical protein
MMAMQVRELHLLQTILNERNHTYTGQHTMSTLKVIPPLAYSLGLTPSITMTYRKHIIK